MNRWFHDSLRGRSRIRAVFLALWCLATTLAATAQPNPKFAPRAGESYLASRTNWLAAPTNVNRAWEFARATFDLAEFATNDTQRAQLAIEGIDATRKAIALDPASAGAHYYLAMNLGQMARTQLLGALRLVSEMEKHFKIAAELDSAFDYAGPDRNLGILYREAPGWPASIGSKSRSRHHLRRSVELSPTYPGNLLELVLAQIEWKELKEAGKTREKIAEILPAARDEFTGSAWEWSWDDWDRMWQSVTNRLGDRHP